MVSNIATEPETAVPVRAVSGRYDTDQKTRAKAATPACR